MMSQGSFYDLPTARLRLGRYVVYRSLNTVYLVRDGYCVTARPRDPRERRGPSPLNGAKLKGFVDLNGTPGQPLKLPYPIPNCRLWFQLGEDDVFSSRITDFCEICDEITV